MKIITYMSSLFNIQNVKFTVKLTILQYQYRMHNLDAYEHVAL